MIFPEGFLWGVSISGFQFEMGDNLGESLDPNTDWYVWVHDEKNIKGGIVSGDFPEHGVDYWHRYRDDHETAKRMGMNAYRIGVEWSRIFPKSTGNINVGVEKSADGKISNINIDDASLEKLEKIADNEALNHYKNIIIDLREKEFKVFVCLNHFTLPIWVHDPLAMRNSNLRKGPRGWLDETSIVEFAKYAGYVAWKLGDSVDSWATFNEPVVVSEAGYLMPQSGFPPAVRNFKAYRKALVNMALAHARAYDAVKKADTVRADEDSSAAADIGLIHNVVPVKPLTSDESGANAAKFMDYMHNRYIIDAVTEGTLSFSFHEKHEESKAYMRNRIDWIGVNYYTRYVVKGKTSILAKLAYGISALPDLAQGYGFACEPRSVSKDGLPTSDFGWEVYPQGILESLRRMKTYGRPMYITENGIADAEDRLRPQFIVDHLMMLDKAINEEKMDCRGYFHWSLIDNYEWAKGFDMKFGLCAVNLETKERIQRKIAEIYRQIIEKGKVDII